MAFLRAAGALSTNVLLALAGPLLTEHAALVTWQPRGAASGLLVEDFNGFLAAAVLGFSVHLRWRVAGVKWLWVAAMLWFGVGILIIPADSAAALRRDISGLDCAVGASIASCLHFAAYTTVAIRVASYSLGALLCSGLRMRKWRWSAPSQRTRAGPD